MSILPHTDRMFCRCYPLNPPFLFFSPLKSVEFRNSCLVAFRASVENIIYQLRTTHPAHTCIGHDPHSSLSTVLFPIGSNTFFEQKKKEEKRPSAQSRLIREPKESQLRITHQTFIHLSVMSCTGISLWICTSY